MQERWWKSDSEGGGIKIPRAMNGTGERPRLLQVKLNRGGFLLARIAKGGKKRRYNEWETELLHAPEVVIPATAAA